MKKLLLKIPLVLLIIKVQTLMCFAQQDPLYSQYRFNRLLINPAYCGSSNVTSGSLTYKNKFVGIEGSPETMGFSIHRPILAQSMAIGLKAARDKTGPMNQNSITAIYAYHLRLGSGKLSFGLEGGLFNQTIDFTNLIRTDQIDEALPETKKSVMLPDASCGAYYRSGEFYAGFSIYHLLQNRIDYTGYEREVVAQLLRHYYLMAGYTINAGENIGIQPSILLKYVTGAPAQVDVNINATYKNMFTVGGGYRSGDAIVFLFQYTFKQRLKFGYSYDYSISQLASYNSGSHGIMLGYNIPIKEKVRESEIIDEDATELAIAEAEAAEAEAIEQAEIEAAKVQADAAQAEAEANAEAQAEIEAAQALTEAVEAKAQAEIEAAQAQLEAEAETEEAARPITDFESIDLNMIKGVITSNGVGLNRVLIKVLNERAEIVYEVNTTENGEFSLENLEPGGYDIYITKKGYFDQISETLTIGIGDEKAIIQNFEMRKFD
ncbi:MAG: hypothetical protein COB85_00535 [Bacteroidetes bacterium]|nr:MAG: hypothetical protein COB85_00535 [Bacteroidota bacterium]